MSRDSSSLNDTYRNGGDLRENGTNGVMDLVGEMNRAARRHDILANDLIAMGYTDNGDDYPSEESK